MSRRNGPSCYREGPKIGYQVPFYQYLALAMAEGQDFAHDTLYRALNQPLALFFELSLELCKAMGGLNRGYLILDDVLIQRYCSGKLGLEEGDLPVAASD